jgi:hypothetical protein
VAGLVPVTGDASATVHGTQTERRRLAKKT